MPEPNALPLERLQAKGLVRWEGGRPSVTRRWRGAVMRATRHLAEQGAPDGDLRLPITLALIDSFGVDEPVEAMADLVEAMLPIQLAELGVSDEGDAAR